MKKIIQFGAGNIGRAFIGRIFGAAGWEIVFVDIDSKIIQTLQNRNAYQIIIKESSIPDFSIEVSAVRAYEAHEIPAIIEELITADLISTSVGLRALPAIAPVLAKGIQERAEKRVPTNIILAENIHHGKKLLQELLTPYLPSGFPYVSFVGVLETSIGKMVPQMLPEWREKDPTLIFSEAYNTLILDRKGYIGTLPELPDCLFVDCIEAYVDAKLFIHNLGHAAMAYIAYTEAPELHYIWEAATQEKILNKVRTVMQESAQAVLCEYPQVFTQDFLDTYREDLLHRFKNKALGDTILRVGKDLSRKLGKEDRVVGAMRLAEKHKVPYTHICQTYIAACSFMKASAQQASPEDIQFHQRFRGDIAEIAAQVSGLRYSDPLETSILQKLTLQANTL